MGRSLPRFTEQERLALRSKSDPRTGCINWTGAIVGGKCGGYGSLGIHGKHWKAHRLSWTVHKGEIPKGLHVLHKCDNRRCVNIDHLFLGTQTDNIRDMDAKGRRGSLRGAKHPNAKLTVAKVRAIRRDRRGCTTVARAYQISKTLAHGIQSRRCWAWVK